MFNCLNSGRTEVQTIVQNRSRRTVQFERKPSQRYARRQSLVLKEKHRPALPSIAPSAGGSGETRKIGRTLPIPKPSEPVEPKVEPKKQEVTTNGIEVDLMLNEEPKVLKPRTRTPPVPEISSLSPPATPTSRSTPSPSSTSRELRSVSPQSSPVVGNGTTTSDDPLDCLIKSIAKETGGFTSVDVAVPASADTDKNVVPNNKSHAVSVPKPLLPEQVKCNIWKAQVDEDLKKSSASNAKENTVSYFNGLVDYLKIIKEI